MSTKTATLSLPSIPEAPMQTNISSSSSLFYYVNVSTRFGESVTFFYARTGIWILRSLARLPTCLVSFSLSARLRGLQQRLIQFEFHSNLFESSCEGKKKSQNNGELARLREKTVCWFSARLNRQHKEVSKLNEVAEYEDGK